MQLNAVEILSVVMGIWIIWIIINYFIYFKTLKKHYASELSDKDDAQAMIIARRNRKNTYDRAVKLPSYGIFWAIVAIWGISYLGN